MLRAAYRVFNLPASMTEEYRREGDPDRFHTGLRRLVDDLTFLESPRWHGGRLWLSEIYAGRVLSVDLTGEVYEMHRVPGQPSGLGWMPDGSLRVVSMTDALLLGATAGGLVAVADLRGHTRSLANDLLVDAAGRCYVGSWGFDLAARESFAPSTLVRVDPDGLVVTVADDLAFPNGMALLDGGRTLLVAETMAAQITAFEVAADGSLSHRRVWAELPGRQPDGIAVDAAGCLWVADAGAHRVLRVAAGGRVTGEVDLEDRRAYACALGGPDGRTLFVCSATSFRRDRALAERSAAVELVRVEVPAG
jgi:sugar lactone lactonase YvrE